MYKLKKNLTNLSRHSKVHDFYSNPDSIYLNRNERVKKFPKKIINKITQSIKSEHLSLYPDFSFFYKKLSKWLNVNSNELYLNEGVSGLVKSIMESYCQPGRSNFIVPFPTFAMYEIYSKMYDLKLKKYKYNKDYKLDFNSLLKLVDKNTSLIIIPNPNVPIEGIINLDQIEKIIKICKKNKIMLVMDEVYFPFSSVNSLNLFNKYKENYIILRSFSKAFGMAGIRLGYAISSKKNINYIAKTRGGYETNNLSVIASSVLIDNYNEVENYVFEVKEGIKYLKFKLDKLNIKYIGGDNGNYIFIILKNKKTAESILKLLITKKIFIRGGWPKPYDNGLLISGAPVNILKKFYKNFEKIILNEKNRF